MADAVKYYQKIEKSFKRDLKALKKQNKMLFSMAKRSGLRRELKKTKNINSKAYKKCIYSSSYISTSD